MRNVTREVCLAFINGKAKRSSNTYTDGAALYLHGHLIAWRHDDAVYCTLAGWPTPTTRDRLNGLAWLLKRERPFHQAKRVHYFRNKPVSDNAILRLV